MSLWRRALAENEFVIDESPLAVEEPGATAEAAPRTRGESAGRDLKDLYTLLGGMLKAHEELSDEHRRLQRDRSQTQEAEIEAFVSRLLPFLDSFDQILDAARRQPATEERANWIATLESLRKRIEILLEKHGLVAIASVGKPVDLDIHEVVDVRRSEEHEDGIVLEERKRGYALNGRLLRCASVVVAQNPE